MNTNQKDIYTSHYYHPKADSLISEEVPIIEEKIKVYATDFANQGRPLENDPQTFFIPKIKGLYQALLEIVLKLIGAFQVLSDNGSHIELVYSQEVEKLNEHQNDIEQDLRLLRKEVKGFENLIHIIHKWNQWKIVLIILCSAESLMNYKILLLITQNQLTALITSLGIAGSLFIISHSVKEVVLHFKRPLIQKSIGISIGLLILLLLYGFSVLRLAFLSETDKAISDSVSPWVFVAVNYTIWLSGTLIALIYKPLWKTVKNYRRLKKVNDKIKVFERVHAENKQRLNTIPIEKSEKLQELQNLRYMSEHYEQVITAHYQSGVALFTSENSFRRKDSIIPKAFSKSPESLNTYFINHQNKQS